MSFSQENLVFFLNKVHDGVAIIWDERSENEIKSDQSWTKDLNELEVSLCKLKYDIVYFYGPNNDKIIWLSKLEDTFNNYSSLICLIFGHKTIDQMKSIVDAFEKCQTLNRKPKLFFNQLEKEKNEDNGSLIRINWKVMKYIDDESIRFYYRHDLNSFFIQNLSKILNTIDIHNEESWLSFNDLTTILSEVILNGPKSIISNNELSFDPDLGRKLGEMGARHFQNGEYDQAISCMEKALDFFKENSAIETSIENKALVLKNLGLLYGLKRNLEQSSTYFKQALENYNRLYNENEGYLIKSEILSSLGAVALLKADFENGIVYFKQAVEMRRKLYKSIDNSDLALSLNNLGACYLFQKDISTAIVYLTESMEMSKRLLNVKKITIDENLAQTLNNLGMAYMSTDSIQKAKIYIHEGLKMRLALCKDNDNEGLATSLNNFGVILLMEGNDLEQADHYLTRGLEMRMRLFKGNTSHPDIIQSLGNCKRLREIRMRRLFIKEFEKEIKKNKTSFCQIL
jgi:tetratricopeptide (TPR) repeat protein